MGDSTDASSKTHYRKAFNSPYLSSADIVEPTVLTIARVELLADQTKKTKDVFNTAFFQERELRPGEKLKPMILNACNSKVMKELADSPFIDDWNNVRVTIYVDHNVKFGRDTVEGLRISPTPPSVSRPVVAKTNARLWNNAKAAYKRDGNLDKVLERADMSEADQAALIEECNAPADV